MISLFFDYILNFINLLHKMDHFGSSSFHDEEYNAYVRDEVVPEIEENTT